MALPNAEELEQTAVGAALRVRPDLAMERDDVPRMHLTGGVAVGDRLAGIMAQETRAFFIDDADLTRLKLRAAEKGVPWRDAEKATGIVTITRPSTIAEQTVLAGSVIETDPDENGDTQSAVVDSPLVLAIGVASGSISVTAGSAGTGGNVAAATSWRHSLGTGWTVVNSEALAGGNAEETAEALRERVRVKSLADQLGTSDALVYHALTVAGVRFASVVEDSLGHSKVYVADENGASNSLMVAAVTTKLQRVAARGTSWEVLGGSLLTQNVAVTITARAGTDTLALVSRIQAAVEARVNKLASGESLTADIIKQAVFNVSDAILTVTVTLPAVTLVPLGSQLIRCGSVSVS